MGRRLSRIADMLALLLVTIALTLTLMELSLRLFEPQQLIVMRPDLSSPTMASAMTCDPIWTPLFLQANVRCASSQTPMAIA